MAKSRQKSPSSRRKPRLTVLAADPGQSTYHHAQYPYSEKLKRRDYEALKHDLQIELLKMQGWVRETGQKLVILFEGRDAAGKGGTIKRFMEHLNPAAPAPSPWRSRPRRSAGSGTSNATSASCRRAAKSCYSTAPGTTAPGSRR